MVRKRHPHRELRDRVTELRNGAGIARRTPGLTYCQRLRWLVAAALLVFRWPRVSVPVRLPDASTVPFRVTHPTDLAVLRDVLYNAQYGTPALNDPALIIDAGSHIGTSVAWFASRYPSCRVIGFEPSPKTYRCLRHNVSRFRNVAVHNIALGAYDGEAAFFANSAPWTSSLCSYHGKPTRARVPVLTLDSALELAGAADVDLLKLDIEGAEYDVLRSCPPDPGRVQRIIGELHTWIDGVGFTDAEFFALFDGYAVSDDESTGEHSFRAISRARAQHEVPP